MSSRARSSLSTPSWRGRWASSAGLFASRTAFRLGLLILGAALIGAGPATAAEKRLALVIGNAAYQGLPPLKNPLNDANDMAASLKARGFEVMRGTDLGLDAMTRLVEQFGRAAKDADVAMVYYAGHGFQLAQQNYLVPVDAKIRSRDDIAKQTLKLNSILQGLESTLGLKLIFLDACRNNPLASAGADIPEGSLQNGLAKVGNAAGFLIAYATQPDNTAFDGAERNSPFAKAVLSHMGTQGQDIASMMIAVRRDVLAVTGGFQVPWENSSLTRQFAFAPGSSKAASPETQLWQLASSGKESALLKIYLARYPEGAHAAEVKSMLGTQVASLDTAVQVRSSPENPNVSDDRLWDLAQRSRMRPLVEHYLARNPDGRHAAEARELLSALPDTNDPNASPEQLCDTLATHPRDATANTSGVPLAELARNADAAISACRKATTLHPEMPHYVALLARAMAAAGRKDESVKLYRDAAERGDLRAMVSLGLLLETGDGVPRDQGKAIALYEKAAASGSPDAAINLAVASMQGNGVPRNPARAVTLLTQAANAGSAIATYNLGVLAQDGNKQVPGDPVGYFKKATELGDARGFLPAAMLLDEGRVVKRDPVEASQMILQGVAQDTGEAIAQLTKPTIRWSPETIKAVQAQLRKGGFYKGAIDGKAGPTLAAPLQQWRRYGSLEATSTQ